MNAILKLDVGIDIVCFLFFVFFLLFFSNHTLRWEDFHCTKGKKKKKKEKKRKKRNQFSKNDTMYKNQPRK